MDKPFLTETLGGSGALNRETKVTQLTPVVTPEQEFMTFVRETEDIQRAALPQRSSRVHRTVVTSVTLVLLITGLYVSVLEPQFVCFRSFTYKSLQLK